MKHVVIIGNGIAGITAARHLRKLTSFKISVISSETPYFFSRTALMYIYMGHMQFHHTKPYEDWFWKKNRIDLVMDYVEFVDTQSKTLTLHTGGRLQFDVLIIASGSKPNMLQWPGVSLQGVQGLYSYPDLQLMEKNTTHTREAIIVGGGLIGIEMAEMLRSRNIQVTMLIREPEFWSNVLPMQDAALVSRLVEKHNVRLLKNTQLQHIQDDGNGKVRAVQTDSGEEISCNFVGITIGVKPSVDFLKESGVEVNVGVLVDRHLQTNVKDIFAIGDCVERKYDLPGRKRIEQVWYSGRMMGEVVAQTIAGNATPYEPGPWFNSAKFFDMEYQTYGMVPAVFGEHTNDYYWEHEDHSHAMHFAWDSLTHVFLGLNTFGIRLKHDVLDKWIREERKIEDVIDNLHLADFDPEFARRYYHDIRKGFSAARIQIYQPTTIS